MIRLSVSLLDTFQQINEVQQHFPFTSRHSHYVQNHFARLREEELARRGERQLPVEASRGDAPTASLVDGSNTQTSSETCCLSSQGKLESTASTTKSQQGGKDATASVKPNRRIQQPKPPAHSTPKKINKAQKPRDEEGNFCPVEDEVLNNRFVIKEGLGKVSIPSDSVMRFKTQNTHFLGFFRRGCAST